MSKRSQFNVVRGDGSIEHVSRVVRCHSYSCMRTIVEYDDGESASKHSGGLPPEVVHGIEERGLDIETADCDHHGGKPYVLPAFSRQE